MEWDESKHPRDEAGRFTDKDSGVSYRQNSDYRDVPGRLKDDAEGMLHYGDNIVYDEPGMREMYTKIKNGQYYTREELLQSPVVKELDAISERMKKQYGDTSEIQTPEREKLREKVKDDFLSMGSMQKDETGKYQPTGEVRKGYKMVIAIGLPAAGKSTRIANPESERLGAFVFDSDIVKESLPEFKASHGAAADSVHKESKNILAKCRAEFLTGSRKGDNIIVPIIGDNFDKIHRSWIFDFENAGYDIEVQYQDADPTESLNRVVARAIETGRIIPSHIAGEYEDKPREVFEKFKKEGKYVKTAELATERV